MACEMAICTEYCMLDSALGLVHFPETMSSASDHARVYDASYELDQTP